MKKNLTIFFSAFYFYTTIAQQWTVFNTLNSGLQGNNVAKILVTRNGVKWFSTTGGISKFDGNTWTPLCSNGSSYIGKSIALDTSDKLWYYRGGCMSPNATICNETGGCFTYMDTVIRGFFPPDTSYSPFHPSFFTIDNSNKIWMFDQTMTKNRVLTFNISDSSWNSISVPTDGVSLVASKERSNIIWYTYTNQLVRFNISTQSYTFHQPNPITSIISDIEFDQSNGLWFGTINSGIYHYDGTNFTNYTTSNSDLPDNNATNVIIDDNGNLWIGTNYGFSVFNGNTWQNFDKSNSGLPYNAITDIAFDINGKVWIATAGEGAVTVSNIVNIDDVTNSDVLKFSPNPSSGRFLFDFTGFKDKTLSRMVVCDIFGGVILDECLSIESFYTLDLAHQPNGVYLFKLMDYTGYQISKGKLIKNE